MYVLTDLHETIFQDFSRLSHPAPALVGIYRGIGFQTDSTPSEFDGDACDISSVLSCVRAKGTVNTMITQSFLFSILTSIPQCALP